MEKNTLKRYGAAILATTFISSVMPMQAFAADVTGHWAEATMKQWEKDGLLKGDGSGSLRPDDSITRAEFMALTNRALGLTKQSNATAKYKDVAQGAWYYNDVAKAVEAGYITGTAQEEMSPLDNITNEQAYTIFARIAKADGTVDLSNVADSGEISNWAKKAVEHAIASGFVAGDKGKVKPQQKTSRAQTITLLDRFKNEDRVFAFPGTYNVKSARNVTILTNGVVLKNTTVSGDLKLGSTVTAVKLENTKVKGNTIKQNKDAKITEALAWKDGTFDGLAEGEKGPVRVKIKIEGGKIKDITIVSHSESEESLKKMRALLKQIVDAGDFDAANLDAEKTMSSRGFLNAIKDAVAQSSGMTKQPGESDEANDYGTLKDGVYEGIAQGYGGKMQLEIKIVNGKIVDIKVVKHSETSAYLKSAERMFKKIIENGDINKVDTISGATVSSRAILNAVKDAKYQASGRTAKAGESKAAIQYNGGGGGGSDGGSTPTEPKKSDYSKLVLPDGSYRGSAIGYGGQMSVTVRVSGGVIASVTVDSHRETSGYYNRAVALLERIVQKNSTDVDTISGATVTSKGILSAVENALSSVKGKEKKEYADGTWYGQGRGHYPYDHNEWGGWKTATEASVTVKDGKITSAKLEYHGDDPEYRRSDGYALIEKHIVANNGTEGLAEIFAKRDHKEPIYDAVSGATNSARGFTNAIEDALNRSMKYKKDGIPQKIRSVTMNKHALGVLTYGEQVDLSGLTFKVKYLDGRVQDIAFADLEQQGIQCSLPMVFTPKPDDERHYENSKDFELKFTHKDSTSKHISYLQASRKRVVKELSKIKFTVKGGSTYEVPLTNKDFHYSVTLKESELTEIENVQVFDSEEKQVEVSEFSVKVYSQPTLSIEMKPLAAAKPEDTVSHSYRFNNYQIALKINAEFNKDKIRSFTVQSDRVKKEYFTGDILDLSGLSVVAMDSNYIRKEITLESLADNGFSVTPSNNSVLSSVGETEVVIKHDKAPDSTHTFVVKVKEKTGTPAKIVLVDSEGREMKTIQLVAGKQVYFDNVLPAKYKEESFTAKVYSEKDTELTPHNITFNKNKSILKVYFTDDNYDYAFLSLTYKD